MEEDDIFRMSNTCRIFNRLIFSPVGLKVMLNNRTKTMVRYFDSNLVSKTSFHVINTKENVDFFGTHKKDIEKFNQVCSIVSLIVFYREL